MDAHEEILRACRARVTRGGSGANGGACRRIGTSGAAAIPIVVGRADADDGESGRIGGTRRAGPVLATGLLVSPQREDDIGGREASQRIWDHSQRPVGLRCRLQPYRLFCRRRASAPRVSPSFASGVINDMSGTYRDQTGPTGVACARQAVQEFNTSGAFDVELLSADHLNKPDVAVSIARKWFDQDGVDVLVDCAASSAALAMASLCREKNKVMIATSTATSDITGKACTPNSLHWVYDTYMVAKSTGTATVKAGGTKWYFVYPNYAFGEALHRDTARFVTEAGGTVAGAETYAFPENPRLFQCLDQGSSLGGQRPGLLRIGIDLINIAKQAAEFWCDKEYVARRNDRLHERCPFDWSGDGAGIETD